MTNILSEDFIMPVHHMDLSEMIDAGYDAYQTMPKNKRETKEYRNRLNELIAEYNERRGMKIYNFIK